MERQYQLTKRGRQIAKQPTGGRYAILDDLYPKNVKSKDELEAIVGKDEASRQISFLLGKCWIEEVGADGFPGGSF